MTPFSSILVSRLFPRFVSVAFCVILMVTVWEAKAQSTGAAWRYLGPDGASVTHIAASGDTLYAATGGGAVFRSLDGVSWLPLNSFRTDALCLGASSGRIITVHSNFPLTSTIISTTGGITTQELGYVWYERPSQIALADSKILGVERRGISLADLSQMQNVRTPFTSASIIFTSGSITCVAALGNIIYAGRTDNILLRSANLGNTWVGISLNFEPKAISLLDNTTLFAASTNAIYLSYNGGTIWEQKGSAPQGSIIQSLTMARGRLYAGTDKGAFFSSDFGKTWQGANAGLSTRYVSQIVANDSAIFVSISAPGDSRRTRMYQLINQNFVPFQIGRDTVPSLQSAGDFFFAVSDTVLWRSRNGKDWVSLGKLPNNVGFGYISAYDNNRTYYAATGDGIYRSLDSGRTWQSAWLKGELVYDFGRTGDTLYAFILNGVYPNNLHITRFSLNGGKNWSLPIIGSDNLPTRKLTPFLDNLYIITQTIYRCIDYCNYPLDSRLWHLQGGFVPQRNVWGEAILPFYILTHIAVRRNEILSVSSRYSMVLGSSDGQRWNNYTTSGLNNTTIAAFAANSKSIFVGTNGGLYILDAPATIVSVKESLALSPEWLISPQPAHDSFTLTFSLPASAHLRCTLHTALGQEIAVLADNAYASGQHDISASVPNVASGLYICRVAVNGRVVGSKSLVITR